MTVREFQARYPWVMLPEVLLETLVTPRRWTCAFDWLARQFSAIVVGDSTGPAAVVMAGERAAAPLRSWLLSRMPVLAALDWRSRKAFWALIWVGTVALQRWPRPIRLPGEDPPIRLLRAPETYPDFRAPALLAPSDVPCQEQSLLTDVAVQAIHLLQDVYPMIATHQPEASNEPEERLRQAYTPLHRLVRTPPRWHPDLVAATREGNLLSALAVGGPFAKLLQRDQVGRFVVDLSHLDQYPVRPGLRRLGCRIQFAAQDGKLRVSGIEDSSGLVTPGASGWALAERTALASLVTHTTVWRQGMEYHVGGLAPVPVLTCRLPSAHPLRRLLAPHMARTIQTNRATHLTLRRNGWDVRALSFPPATVLRYYDDGARAFDVRRLDVRADAARRGVGAELDYPYLRQAGRYWDIIQAYVHAYLEHFYPDEQRLLHDREVQLWFEALDCYLVGGVRHYVPALSRQHLAQLCTLIINSVSVAHSENSMWDYAPFLPTTVRLDGAGQSVGEVQMTLDFQYLICAHQTLLLQDWSQLALDAEAAAIMQRFHRDVLALQGTMEQEPDRYWRLLPSEVAASVSA